MLAHQQFVVPVAGRGLSDFSTGLFCWPPVFLGGDGSCTWGFAEVFSVLLGGYALYAMVFQAKQTKYRAEMAVGRRRKSRAAKYREKAKRLEAQTTGFGGLLF